MNEKQRNRALEILRHASRLYESLLEQIEQIEVDKTMSPEKVAELDHQVLEEMSTIAFWIDQFGEEFLNDE